jgi:hypothetical protein
MIGCGEIVMTPERLLDSPLWKEFERQTRREKKKPANVLAKLIREYLEIADDVALDEAMTRDAQKSGYKEADAERLVREYRAEKKRLRRATS